MLMLRHKWLWITIGILFLFGIGLFFAKDLMFKNFVYAWVKDHLGVTAVTGQLKTGPLLDTILIEGMNLTDSPKSQEIYMKGVSLKGDYDFQSLFQDSIHFLTLDLYIEQVEIVRDKNQQIHLKTLKSLTQKNLSASEVNLSIDTIRFSDNGQSKPTTQVIPVNIQAETYHDIENLQDLLMIIETRVIDKANLHFKLTKERNDQSQNFGDKFKSGVKHTTNNVKQFFKKVFKKKKKQ